MPCFEKFHSVRERVCSLKGETCSPWFPFPIWMPIIPQLSAARGRSRGYRRSSRVTRVYIYYSGFVVLHRGRQHHVLGGDYFTRPTLAPRGSFLVGMGMVSLSPFEGATTQLLPALDFTDRVQLLWALLSLRHKWVISCVPASVTGASLLCSVNCSHVWNSPHCPGSGQVSHAFILSGVLTRSPNPGDPCVSDL